MQSGGFNSMSEYYWTHEEHAEVYVIQMWIHVTAIHTCIPLFTEDLCPDKNNFVQVAYVYIKSISI